MQTQIVDPHDMQRLLKAMKEQDIKNALIEAEAGAGAPGEETDEKCIFKVMPAAGKTVKSMVDKIKLMQAGVKDNE